MSWKIIEKYRNLLADERGAVHKNWGGKVAVCLVYPNHYQAAMSNLGFQAVYSLLNGEPDIVCERAFLPDRAEGEEYSVSRSKLLSLESQRPLADFAVIAFSVSFESDYLHIPSIFELAGIPPFTADRDRLFPLVVAGGAALFLNPEPVADFMDLIVVGEVEPVLPAFLNLLRQVPQQGRVAVLQTAVGQPGFYVPALYESVTDRKGVTVRPREGVPANVDRVWAKNLDLSPTMSRIFTPVAEFGDMYLVELSRGCSRGCRFCAAGFMYLPSRQRSLASVKGDVEQGLSHGQRIGLVGAAVSDFRGVGELARFIIDRGATLSVSSLRIDGLDEDMLAALAASGHKTIAIAPEGGSQRLRDIINKNLSEEQILAACARLSAVGILNLKLYFIIGLPTETMTDLEEMVHLLGVIREQFLQGGRVRGRLGEIVLSINPFIPKPFTPFQWCGMEAMPDLERKVAFLQKAVRRLANVRLKVESLKEARLQALLARGDRRLGPFLVNAARLGTWKRAAREAGLEIDRLVTRSIPLAECLPWDVIGGVDKERLQREYRKAFAEAKAEA